MTITLQKSGGAPVGLIAELDGIGAASVIYLRMWYGGPLSKAAVWKDFSSSLGLDHGRRALKSFENLCRLCSQHGRRPLVRHAINCKCIGSDESCFANFITTAANDEREDAILIATLLVRTDIAPLITSLATDFGLALMRMDLRTPNGLYGDTHHPQSNHPKFH